METYATMTPAGGYGSSFQADSWEDAERQAIAAGYDVVDWTTGLGEENILVIAE